MTHLHATSKRLCPLIDGATVSILNMIVRLKTLGVKEINFTWIPGHENFLGNELADHCAKLGSSSNEESSLITTLMPASELRQWMKLRTSQETLSWIGSNLNDSIHFDLAPSRDTFFTFRSNPCPEWSNNRKVQIMMFRLMSSHTNTKDHWNRLTGKEEDLSCRRCRQAPESAEHILTQCSFFWGPNSSPLKIILEERQVTFWEALDNPDVPMSNAFRSTLEVLSKWGVVV